MGCRPGLYTPSQQPLAYAFWVKPRFVLSTHGLCVPAPLAHIRVYVWAPPDVERQDGVNVAQAQGRILLYDLLGGRAVTEGGDNGIQCDSGPADTQSAISVRHQRNGFSFNFQCHVIHSF